MLAIPGEPPKLAFGWRFRPLHRVGVGATSEVWEALDRETGMTVALKVGSSAELGPVFANEAERQTLATSPLIPELIDVGWLPPGLIGASNESLMHVAEGKRRPYLVSTWVRGKSLDACAPDTPGVRHALAMAVARDIGSALADLHVAGVAHGDVKPTNILLEEIDVSPDAPPACGWRARLVDLGLAVDAGDRQVHGATPRYLPAEVWSGATEADPRARDRFALGLVIAELLSPEVRACDHDVARLARNVELPAPFDRLCAALLSPDAGARPRASWIAMRARAELGIREPVNEKLARRRRAIRGAYLASRQIELAAAATAARVEVLVEGLPGEWLRQASGVARRATELRGNVCDGPETRVGESDARRRSRWLLGVVGAAAVRWPLSTLSRRTDAEWAGALVQLTESVEPASLALTQVEQALARLGTVPGDRTEEVTQGDTGPSDVELALALGDAEQRDAAIRTVEARASVPAVLRRAAADALRRMGEMGRAWALLAHDSDPDVASLRSEVARRAGDAQEAERQARLAVAHAPHDGRAHGVLARLAIDRGQPGAALELLTCAPASVYTLEAKVIALIGLGRAAEAETALALAEGLATTEEARGRVAGLAGFVAHERGEMARSLEAFGRAAQHASNAGALVEEATYLSGEAAAAVEQGHIDRALRTSHRAVLLWDHLGRARHAARASLATAAAFAAAGAVFEAKSASADARERARASGDQRAEAFALWAITDVLGPGETEARAAAVAAATLLETAGLDADKLRAAARVLRHAPDRIGSDTIAWGDELAGQESTLVAARLEWWGARAEASLAGHVAGRRELAVLELCQLVARPAPIASRGPAFASAAALAGRTGDGNAVRLLTHAQAEAARELLSGLASELRESALVVPWVRSANHPTAPEVTAEQIGEFEALVRALGTRDRLRPLLDQVLDALVLWTGVERGLLLLPAPNGKLVPRAGRNLARNDLRGEQLQLSQSLARRAVELREPVVAVDAAGDMPSMHASVHALKLRSVLAIPLIARGDAVGVVYLDDRVRRGAFGPKELAWVRLVASLAAIAIADARDQLLLRRAVRRAERAKHALGLELSRREVELDRIGRELTRTREAAGTRFRYDAIIGRSEPIQQMLRIVDRVTSSDVPVLLVGESGSGKELIARAIHTNGPRASHVFVGENCSAIPEPLLESTLFGHTRGAFTGADRTRAGLFEIANHGTLFLDEIGEMSLPMQAKLLRVLQEGEVRPLGAPRGHKVDVRIVAATHRSIEQMVKAGTFREDLFYRLHVITIRVPPLRERCDDIPLLVHHFIEKHGEGRKIRVTADAMSRLKGYDWPGNVRQLENELRRALVLCDGTIDRSHLSKEIEFTGDNGDRKLGLRVRDRVDALEKELVESALSETSGNQTRAAEMLGLSRFGLQKMMKRLGIRSVER